MELPDNDKMYYVYIKAERSNQLAEWYVSTEQLMFDYDINYYHFLLGVIFPVSEDHRDISFKYGMSYITGGAIYGDVIKSINYVDDDSNEGSMYDLNNGSIRIGNKLKGLFFGSVNKIFKLFGITLEFRNADDEIVSKIDGDTGEAFFGKGAHIFYPDGSGSLANGNVTISKEGDVMVAGALRVPFSFHDYSNTTSGPWNVTVSLTRSFNHHITLKMGYPPLLILPNGGQYQGVIATLVGGTVMGSGIPVKQEEEFPFNSEGNTSVTLTGNHLLRFIAIPRTFETDKCQWILLDNIDLGNLLP